MSDAAGWRVENMRRETCVPAVFGAGRLAIVADLVHDTGATMSVSRYDDESGWGVDAAFSANGMPQWSNGTGARYLSVRTVGDDGAELLDAAAAELERV